jgi:iron complex outermembrane receptor protein
MDIEDTQYNKYENDTWVTGNAGSSHSLGAELELTYFLTDSLELTAALGIIEAEYDDYDDGTVNWDGESIQNTPSYSGRIGAAYYNPNGFYARGDVRSQGEVPYWNSVNSEFHDLDSYITADVKIGYRFKGFDIYAFCNNLTDEEYITFFNAASGKSLATYGDPRTFGIGVRYSF